MKALWDRIERWHAKHDAPLQLRPGATESEIAAAEKTMGLKFPADFRASLLAHDGQDEDCEIPWSVASCPLASLDRIVAQWEDERESDSDDEELEVILEDRFRNTIFHKQRIPIAGTPFWDGDNTYLDLTPGPKGVAGQVVAMTSECDFVILDDSFKTFLERYANDLENGTLIWSDGEVVPSDGKWDGHPADSLALVTDLDDEDDDEDDEEEDEE